MRRKREPLMKRTVSGSLAALMTAISVLSTSGAVPAYASEAKVKLSYQQENMEKIGLYVQAENESFAPGEEVNLTIYIQNNSNQPLTEGTLKWVDKKETLQNAAFVYETEDGEEEEKATPDSAQEEVTEAGEAEETEASEEMRATGPASDFGQDDGITVEEDWFGEDEQDDAEQSGPYLDEDGYVRNISLAPGEIFQIPFTAVVNEDIFGIRTRDIRFTFGARTPNNKRLSNYVKYQFNTGLMTMQPVELVGGNQVETNEENTMIFRLDMDDIEYMFEDNKNVSKASDSNAIASPSEAEAEFTPAEVIDSDTAKATPSEAEQAVSEAEKETPEAAVSEAGKATASEAKQEEAEEENAEKQAEKATASETTEENDSEEEDPEEENEGVFRPEEVKYSIETYGVRLKGVKARFDEEASGPAESVTEVSYRVASDTKPGFYFGKVTASVRYNGNAYKTEQGFVINVIGEGQMTLRGRLGDAEIIVSGEPESFGADDSEILSLQVTEVPVEKEELISTAMEKKAEETGVAVEKMKAMDIKVIADGEVRELSGPVTVTFAGLKLDKVSDPAEPEKEESLAEKAAALLNLDGESAEESGAENSTEVWHLDEDAVELNDMESYINEDGDVVMETDHFSIFVVVDTGNVGGPIDVTIEHWASVRTIAPWQDSDGKPQWDYQESYTASTDPTHVKLDKNTDSNGKRYGYYTVDNVYDYTKQEVVNYSTEVIPIYTPDTIRIPNKKKYNNVEELSKICLSTADKEYVNKNYQLKEIWVSEDEENAGQSFWNVYTKYIITRNNEGTITNVTIKTKDKNGESSQDLGNSDIEIRLMQNSLVRFIYEEKKAGITYQNVTFYDHNLTNGGADKAADAGMNDSSNFSSGTAKMGVGQWASGNQSSWSSVSSSWNGGKGRLNAGNGYNEVYGVTADNDIFPANGERKYSVIVKGEVKEALDSNYDLQFADGIAQPGFFTEGKKGLKTFTNYKLGFQQNGDTYILSTVRRNANETVLDSLEKIKYSAHSGSGDTNIYSNEFWPLDKESYEPMDAKRQNNSDDGKTHNWHFGMRFDLEFTIGDYTGPMNYYFRGDDDFWLFVDGKRAIDLGGIHSAVGQALDLRTWLEKEEGTTNLDKTKTHRISIYYMERGGYGSCCYMQYTIPNAKPIESPTVPTTSVSVNKQWFDNNNVGRPESITVQLLRKTNNTNEQVIDTQVLSAIKNGWSYTWTSLPTENVNNSSEKYTYSVKEEETPSGYIQSITSSGDSWTIINTLLTEVRVRKVWSDNNNEDQIRPDSVQVQLMQNGINYGDPVVLNENNQWSYVWSSLPKCLDKTKEYVYTVKEISIPSWYTAAISGSQDEGYVITNGHTPEYVTRTIKKIWEDHENRFELRPETLKIQLKQNGVNYGEEITLPLDGKWEYTWETLPKYYYTKENNEIHRYEYTYSLEEKTFDNDGYYNASQATSNDITTITNTLKTAKFRLAKRIDTLANISSLQLDHYQDLYKDEFIISAVQDNGSFTTGVVLSHAGDSDQELDMSKISGYIEVPVKDQVTFAIDEIAPKEYVKADPFLTIRNVTDGNAELLNNNSVVLKPGADVIVIVHNVFKHSDYFHDDDSVTNDFSHEKIPVQTAQADVNLNALIPEKLEEEKQFM